MSNAIRSGTRALVVAGVVLLVAILATQTFIVVGVGKRQGGISNDPNATDNTITVSGVG